MYLSERQYIFIHAEYFKYNSFVAAIISISSWFHGLATRVPRSFVVDMFNNAFWEAQDQRQDVGPIDVPTIGCFVSRTARYRE